MCTPFLAELCMLAYKRGVSTVLGYFGIFCYYTSIPRHCYSHNLFTNIRSMMFRFITNYVINVSCIIRVTLYTHAYTHVRTHAHIYISLYIFMLRPYIKANPSFVQCMLFTPDLTGVASCSCHWIK